MWFKTGNVSIVEVLADLNGTPSWVNFNQGYQKKFIARTWLVYHKPVQSKNQVEIYVLCVIGKQ